MKTLLKNVLTCSVFFIIINNLFSHEVVKNQKEIIIHLKSGYSFSDSKWEFSHPLYDGNGRKTIKYLNGSSSKGFFFETGIEMKNSRSGWRINLGTRQSEIIVNPDNLSIFETKIVNFNTNYFDLNRVYYLDQGNSGINTFVYGGLGLIKCSGEIKNSGASINFGAGLVFKPLKNLFFTIGLDGKVPYYFNFKESDTMNKTIHYFDPAISLGISYLFK